jgi:hypothetical protein
MDSYELAEPFSRETTDLGTGALERVTFKAGKHRPKNEAEEAALEEAVRLGVASRVKSSRPKKRVTARRDRGRPARPSPEPTVAAPEPTPAADDHQEA